MLKKLKSNQKKVEHSRTHEFWEIKSRTSNTLNGPKIVEQSKVERRTLFDGSTFENPDYYTIVKDKEKIYNLLEYTFIKDITFELLELLGDFFTLDVHDK